MFKTPKNQTVVSIYEPVEFPVENPEELALEFDVVNLAKQQARKDEPRPDGSGPDANELHFFNKMKVKATQAVNSVDQSISNLRDEIQRISSVFESTDAQEMGTEFKRKVSAEFVPVLKDIESLNRDYCLAEDDLNGFKRQNGLRRNPHYPASNWLTVGILLLALIAESVLNGTFFAAGSDAGLIGGVAEAFIIALVNIGIGFLLGWWLFRYKNHYKRSISLSATGAFTALLAIPLIFNLLVAHYREALTQEPDNAARAAMQSFSDGILAINDVNSWLLFAVGVLFCVLATYKGYGVDDVYPGYGKLARRKDELEDELRDERDEALSHLEELHTEFLERLNKRHEHVAQKEKLLNSLSSSFDLQKRILDAYLSHLEDGLQYIIKLYRDTNSAERESECPQYFSEPISLQLGGAELDVRYQDKRQIMAKQNEDLSKQLPEIRTLMLEIKEEYHNKIEKACQQ